MAEIAARIPDVSRRVPPELAREYYTRSGADRWHLSIEQYRAALEASVARAFTVSSPTDAELRAYVAGLHHDDLALAVACAAGVPDAWEHFVGRFRPLLNRAAAALDPGTDAADLADSLYAELYGLVERDGVRRSLFRYFHGRSRLTTWLRAVLAQRHIDGIRTRRRDVPLPGPDEVASPVVLPTPEPGRAQHVAIVMQALAQALAALAPRDRLRLRCYYVQQLSLAVVGRLLGEHEATVSRHLTSTRAALRHAITATLHAEHRMDDAAVTECLRAAAEDPGALDLQRLLDDDARMPGSIVQDRESR